KSAKNVVGQIETGRGALHYVIYDKQSAEEFAVLMANASQTAARLDGAIAEALAILKDVREGNGSAHALLYDQKLSGALAEVGKAAEEIASLVHDAKKAPNGAVNQIVYGDARGLFTDLGQAAADLREIT